MPLPTPSVSVTLYQFSLFFFSSRRRHTRLVSDWSSDVCSSDLTKGSRPIASNPIEAMGLEPFVKAAQSAGVDGVLVVDYPPEESKDLAAMLRAGGRSEERRVGKECRSRWSPYH